MAAVEPVQGDVVWGEATVVGESEPPPLHEIFDALKQNLGLDGTFEEVVNAACLQLGVPPTGSLHEKGNACWRAMYGSVQGEAVATDEATFSCFPGSGTGDKFTAGATPPTNLGQQWDITRGAPFTMCVRVRVGKGRPQGGRILAKRSGGAGWEFVVPRYSGYISFFAHGKHINIGNTKLNDGAWHHVAVVYGGLADSRDGLITAYLDGNSDGAAAFGDCCGSIAPCPSVPLMAGARYPSDDLFHDGEFQEVKVYPWALDAEQLRRIARGERAGAKEGAVVTSPPQIAGTYDTLVFCIFRASYVITATADPSVVRAQVYVGNALKGAFDMRRSAGDIRIWEGVFPPDMPEAPGATVRWQFVSGYGEFVSTAFGKPPRRWVKRPPGASAPCCVIS